MMVKISQPFCEVKEKGFGKDTKARPFCRSGHVHELQVTSKHSHGKVSIQVAQGAVGQPGIIRVLQRLLKVINFFQADSG